MRRRSPQLQQTGPDRLGADEAAAFIGQAAERARMHGLDAELEAATARRTLKACSAPGHFCRKPAPSVQAALVAPLEGRSVFDVLRDPVTSPVLLVNGGRPPPIGHLPDIWRELDEALIAGVCRELTALEGEYGPVRVARVEEAGHKLHLQEPGRVGRLVRDVPERVVR